MWKNFLSLWLKFPCPLCQRVAENTVCVYCQQRLKNCQLGDPKRLWHGDLPVFAWGKYEGELKRAIAVLKYDHHPEIGVLLGKWLAESWQQNHPIPFHSPLTVVPIPLHQTKLQERGFNQAVSIATGFCQETGYQLQPEALIRTRASQAMFGLNRSQRQQNLKNAFVINQNWAATKRLSPILLIDDIYTTGTTIKEAFQILSQQKYPVLGALAIATPSIPKLTSHLNY